jgi:hypothetical protein
LGLILEIVFLWWFLACHAESKETAKKRDKKIEEKNHRNFVYPSIVLQKVFDMEFFQKVFDGVFERPLVETRSKTP